MVNKLFWRQVLDLINFICYNFYSSYNNSYCSHLFELNQDSHYKGKKGRGLTEEIDDQCVRWLKIIYYESQNLRKPKKSMEGGKGASYRRGK